MRIDVGEGLRVFRRVIEFVLTIVVKPTIGAVATHVETLTGVVGRLTAYVVLQDESDRACRSLARDARLQALILRQEYMLPIARIARTLFRADEGARQSLAAPRATTYEGMIAGALALAGRAKEHRQLFVDAGCDADFVERLIASPSPSRRPSMPGRCTPTAAPAPRPERSRSCAEAASSCSC